MGDFTDSDLSVATDPRTATIHIDGGYAKAVFRHGQKADS
jgi:hypothetical protein